MSLAGYETIFHSANSFGALKALKAELGKEEKRDEVNQLQAKADNYKKEISELKVCHRIELFILYMKFFPGSLPYKSYVGCVGVQCASRICSRRRNLPA